MRHDNTASKLQHTFEVSLGVPLVIRRGLRLGGPAMSGSNRLLSVQSLYYAPVGLCTYFCLLR